MAYKLIFVTRNGNTTVEVEDLYRSGAGACVSCKKASCGDYPGVCQHCGKLHIRYLAHVKQDVADTLNRAVNEVANPVERTDEEIAALGIALLGGQSKKAMDVGCVCVAKYLVDCGVDAGLAERFQSEVTKVTSMLQQAAALDSAKTPERVEEAIRRAGIVLRLRARAMKLRSLNYHKNLSNNSDLRNRMNAAQNVAWRSYEEARERWSRETHGMDLYGTLPDAATLVRHYETKLAHVERRLSRFSTGATFRA
jgi:hypothetical protein